VSIQLPLQEKKAQTISWNCCAELFRLSVQVSVPLIIDDLRRQGGPSDAQWSWVRCFANELAAHGDILQFTGEQKGETAIIFNRFARALAILAFLPGGVRFAEMHFEARGG
jgi:hypothetical protein